MPELPEVETVGRGLAAKLLKQKVASVWQGQLRLRIPMPARLDVSLQGKKLEAVERRAKYLLLRFSGHKTLIVHLGMSGRMTIADAPAARQKHDHLVISFADGAYLTFNDARRFGLIDLVETGKEESHPLFQKLGPEPLEKSFTPARLAQQLEGRKTALKVALLDQSVVVGVGNIYASEALFLAGIHPLSPAGEVTEAQAERLAVAVKQVLGAAIKSGGSTLRDYIQTDGKTGYFQHRFVVYGREGEPCRECAVAIEHQVMGGRATFYCPNCQTVAAKKGRKIPQNHEKRKKMGAGRK